MAAVLDRVQPTYRSYISQELWDRLVGRMVEQERFLHSEAERIMDATLGFLLMCGQHPGMAFSPSPRVDIGWHTFLMYTRDYRQFCLRDCGRFIDHEPNDRAGVSMSGGRIDTVAFMRQHHVIFDPTIWGVTASDCEAPHGPPSLCAPSCTCSCDNDPNRESPESAPADNDGAISEPLCEASKECSVGDGGW